MTRLLLSGGILSCAMALAFAVAPGDGGPDAPLVTGATTGKALRLPGVPASPEGMGYVVQPGDSLAGIALRHYGTATAEEIIYRANRDKLASPGAVRPGMRLKIPAM
ncbi:LysM peptidoglycan-binding domain-containing protein [Marinovum algicola]|uniref:LysM peptidoglycan-binding domain-containing protein n=1 Tax=Marinovum algicola TaxID=42444 RepID=UPI00065B2E50|nr:LysM domain-containing protein [Marinovum algicola]AKO98407.1 LysM domain protein [Marinovum algicola DG 898]